VSIAVTVVIGLAITWAALFVAYYRPYPIGFFVTTFAFVAYLTATGWRHLRARARPARDYDGDRPDRLSGRRPAPASSVQTGAPT
jgi:membrane protein implicated in regulation of membrane protease activity